MSEIALVTINAKWIHPSLALRLLKANLGPLEDKAEILEFALRQPLEEKIEGVLKAGPRILAFSVYIWNHVDTLELLRKLEQRWENEGLSKPFIIMGGPEVAYLDQEAELVTRADWVVRGEGELVFRRLCEALLNGDTRSSGVTTPVLPSLKSEAWDCITQVEGKLIITRPVALDKIDPAYRLYTEKDLTRKMTYVEASRGCPFGCEFCLSSLDPGVRNVPLQSFLQELEGLIDQGARNFKFLDRTFNLDIQRGKTIMEFFLAHLKPGLCVHFEMVPSRFPPELRDTLKRFPPGSLRLEVGIQTLNTQVASTIGRKSDPHKELEALDFLRHDTYAIVHADLIAGLPGENFSSFAEGFDRLWAHRPGEIQLGILKRLPGAPLARHDAAYGMRYSPVPPYEVVETAAMTGQELDRLKNYARFWELIVNRDKFPDQVFRLLPEGKPAFDRFLTLSDMLLERFGRNWGIDRQDLLSALEDFLLDSCLE